MKRIRVWLALLLITALCWADYSIFTEGYTAMSMSDSKRRLAHFVILLLLIPVGYWGFAAHKLQWMKKIWLLLYLAGLFILIVSGLLQWQWQLFSTPVMDRFSALRLFLTSPVPYFLLFLLAIVLSKEKQPANTEK